MEAVNAASWKVPQLPVALALLLAVLSSQAPADTLTGKVVKVADGDTITVLVGREQHRICLQGIDAPESGSALRQGVRTRPGRPGGRERGPGRVPRSGTATGGSWARCGRLGPGAVRHRARQSMQGCTSSTLEWPGTSSGTRTSRNGPPTLQARNRPARSARCGLCQTPTRSRSGTGDAQRPPSTEAKGRGGAAGRREVGL